MSKVPIPNLTSIGIDVEKEIASGGMGTVYRARRRGPGEFTLDVAVKVIKSNVTRPDVYREKILAEAALTAKLRHPNIVQIYDFQFVNDDPILIMEWIDGKTLHQIIQEAKESGSLIPGGAILKIADETLSALITAHEYVDPHSESPRPIIHRDVTPKNIMVDRNGVVRILDFGIATLQNPDNSDITLPQDRFVNPAYSTPEHHRGGAIDETTDLFQLGKTLGKLMATSSACDEETNFLSSFINTLTSEARSSRYQSARVAQAHLRTSPLYSKAITFNLCALLTQDHSDLVSTSQVRASTPSKNGLKPYKGVKQGVIALILFSAVAGIYFLFPAIKQQIQRSGSLDAVPRLVWRKNSQDIDLSDSDPRKDIAALNSAMAPVPCFNLCFQIETLSLLPFPTAGRNALIQTFTKVAAQKSTSPEKLYLDSLDAITQGPALRAASRVASQNCILHDVCEAANQTYYSSRSLLSNIHIAPSLSLSEMIQTIEDENLRQGANGVAVKTKSVVSQKRLRDISQFEAKVARQVTFYQTDTLANFDMIVVDATDPNEWSSSDCKTLGDWFYAKRLSNLRNNDPKQPIESYILWIFPKDNALKILGTRGKDLIVDFYNAASSAIFRRGLCLYVRESGELRFVRHWVPNSVQ